MNGQLQHLRSATRTPPLQTVLALEAVRAESRAESSDRQERESSSAAADGQRLLAETATIAAVEAYWDRLAPDGPALRAPPIESQLDLEALQTAARRFGRAVAQFPVSEASYRLSLLYTGLLPEDWRATPEFISHRRLWRIVFSIKRRLRVSIGPERISWTLQLEPADSWFRSQNEC